MNEDRIEEGISGCKVLALAGVEDGLLTWHTINYATLHNNRLTLVIEAGKLARYCFPLQIMAGFLADIDKQGFLRAWTAC